MEMVFERRAGSAVHQRSVVVGRLTRDARGGRVAEPPTFGTTTGDRLRRADWLTAGGCTHGGLESTGECWKPVFNVLAATVAVWLPECGAQQSGARAQDGRQRCARRIAEWLAHGLVRPRCIPPRPQRELRDRTRYRTTFVRARATLVNRGQKVLAGANRKLAAVATDSRGVSGRAILAALLAGAADPAALAELATGPRRKQRPQLQQALR